MLRVIGWAITAFGAGIAIGEFVARWQGHAGLEPAAIAGAVIAVAGAITATSGHRRAARGEASPARLASAQARTTATAA